MLEGSHITIVTQYYWPEHVGIAPYSTRLAEHLAERGAAVNVVTAMPHYPSWRIEPDRYRRLDLHEERRGAFVDLQDEAGSAHGILSSSPFSGRTRP